MTGREDLLEKSRICAEKVDEDDWVLYIIRPEFNFFCG